MLIYVCVCLYYFHLRVLECWYLVVKLYRQPLLRADMF